jgi:hypothetical protein
LPARLLLPRPGSERFTHLGVDDGLLAGGRLDELLPAPTGSPSTGHATVWNAELLRWRLARPGANYILHIGRDVLLVSTTDRVGPVRVAVLLKVLLRQPATGPLPSGPLAAALAAHHRTPFVLHWGANPSVHFTGPRIPRRLQPSPLELVLHHFTDDGGSPIGDTGILLTSFEFLDFDAY